MDELTDVLSNHDDVDGIWYFGSAQGSKNVELNAAANMKRTWVNYGRQRDWTQESHGMGKEFIRRCTEIKNIWVPYGA
jgi:aldehyde dehydrogenase (NAD+)